MTFKLIGLNEFTVDTCITPWIFIHFLSGIYITYILAYFKLSNINSLIIFNIIHFIYEIKDYIITYYIKKGSKDNLDFYNSFINSIGDTIGAFIGSFIMFLLLKSKTIPINNTILIILTISFVIIYIIMLLFYSNFKFG